MTRFLSILILSAMTAVSAPVISGVSAPVTNSTLALVTWQTDIPAQSLAEWGLTTAYGERGNREILYRTNHEAVIRPLTPATTYFYRLSSRARDGTSSTNTGSFVSANGSIYYASTTGTTNADGSISTPWNAQKALGGGRAYYTNASMQVVFTGSTVLQPGDTVYFRGGTYPGLAGVKDPGEGVNRKRLLVVESVGESNSPIVFASYPGELAVIDGGVDAGGNVSTAGGKACWYYGFEFTDSDTNRINDVTTGDNRYPAINLRQWAPHSRVINSRVHDGGHPGIGFWNQGAWGELYGNTVWGNGIHDYDFSYPGSIWTRGSGVYTQNNLEDAVRLHDNMWLWNFTEGINGYGESGVVGGYDVQGNTSFENFDTEIFLTGTSSPGTNFNVQYNAVYLHADHLNYRPFVATNGVADEYRPNGLAVGYQNYDQENIQIANNYVASTRYANQLSTFERAWIVRGWGDIIATNNTIIGGIYKIEYRTNSVSVSADWDRNIYHHVNTWKTTPFYDGGADVQYTFANWQSTFSFDLNSTYSTSLPSTNFHLIRPNKYERGRAHITVFNWEGNSTETITLDDNVLTTGETYVVYDVEDLTGDPVASGTYNGTSITVPMNTVSRMTLAGEQHIIHATVSHTTTDFGAFLLLKSDEQQEPEEIPPAEPQRFRVGRGRRPAFFP